ncbi:four-carbon acid sugar kinase family protein [Bacillaceae bacterium SIJ1]|uniref:four-carbon acid sugar kinase family protein n=1 Tax=Litoribacterium kuwaitense TaxID=1398745 RepID=UPI0013EB73F1|nr:four-carbon acid sugar kinase family protein [Litoribacterium kuwaitense]NGP45154.1 four-carbon acid sugar kinase family protein [Litoribacterium kuwaitense]
MSFRFGMIADDLTGANDSGIQLKEKGLETSVYFEIPEPGKQLDEAIVLDTDSRARDKENAYHATKTAALFLKENGYQHIYKKMDSTLRGYIGTELMALDDVFEPTFIVVAPAYPPYGRTTKNGVHLLNGVPVSETELANDPKHPVKQAHLPTLIESETGKNTALISGLLEGTPDDWMLALNEFKQKEIKYLISDAATIEDLRHMADMIHQFSSDVIWSGSAGLAEVLPGVLNVEKQRSDRAVHLASSAVMTVCGSLSQTTQQQVRYAAQQEGVATIDIDTELMFLGDWDKQAETYYEASVAAIRAGKDVVLYVPSTSEMREKVSRRAEKLGMTPLDIGKRISTALGALTNQIVATCPELNALVLTGGDTAKDVAKSLGATGFSLNHQLEAGIPLGDLIGIDRKIKVVTKAGAFGTESSIYRAMQTLKGESQHE